ncbi:unnamed protein product [Brachionus calyciflorus]|uniref:CCHC-type domain-containing protein n=1 Tax=Brachionus calyciflorus TaxID=104777 RepID=A0A814FL47_9BILA|nr:unnamed protein product [Brachionus calyciflorus]
MILEADSKKPIKLDDLIVAVNQVHKKSSNQASSNGQNNDKVCFKCGKKHRNTNECPAAAKQCWCCGKSGHFAQLCKQKDGNGNSGRASNGQSHGTKYNSGNSGTRYSAGGSNRGAGKGSGYNRDGAGYNHDGGGYNRKQVRIVEEEDDSDGNESRVTWRVRVRRAGETIKNWLMPLVTLFICGQSISFTVDTRAEVNIIDENTFNKLNYKPKLYKCDTKFYKSIELIVTKGGSGNLLSYCTSVELGIINRINIVNSDGLDPSVEEYKIRYPKLFSGKIGELKNHQIRLHIDETIKPIQQKLRPNDIKPVNGPTPWVSPIVPVQKPGKPNEIRICTDAREANKAILRSRHTCPTLEDLAVNNESLRELVKKKAKWNWTEKHGEALQKLKQSICTDSLCYFDPKMRTELTVDASPVGLAGVMAQYDPRKTNEKRIVMYASRKITKVEQRYSQVERETLGVVWACEKFHLYIFANEFDIVTDKKAVELIFGKVRSKPKARIERWCLRLLPYKATPHTSTGVAPFQLMLQANTQTTKLPSSGIEKPRNQLHEKARVNDAKAKAKMTNYGNQKLKVKKANIKVCDLVLKKLQRKFKSDPYYDPEPYKVIKIYG